MVNKPEYWGASGGLEYEAAWALGAANGVGDLEALQYANLLCNEVGMDPISFGATVGAAMELYDMGILTKEQIGIEAPFGSAQALVTLAEMTAHGEGFGKELGQGSKRLCTKYGHPDLSMTVKGQEFPAYDSRGIQGMGLAYATSNRGACHLRGYTVASEVLGIPVKTDPLVTEGKPALVKAFQDATAVFDSAGLCIFTSFAWGLADIQPQIQAACEGDWSLEQAEPGGRAHLEHGEAVQPGGRPHQEGRRPAAAAQDRAGQDRPRQGPGQRPRRDAAGVLRAARLDGGGRADQGHPRPPRPLIDN